MFACLPALRQKRLLRRRDAPELSWPSVEPCQVCLPAFRQKRVLRCRDAAELSAPRDGVTHALVPSQQKEREPTKKHRQASKAALDPH